eukprot:m.231316 g.231316  ORF g.231316 m.231316 type:complete len:408 (+) comp16006_c1_seq9:28-1251(+)
MAAKRLAWCVFFVFCVSTQALDNGVGLTPPMGFNPWNVFGISSKGTCKLPLPWAPADHQCHGFNESVIIAVGEALVSSGLKDVGFKYVNLDCGYSTGHRDSNGSLVVNTTRYPHGMVWLGNQLHTMGLQFGMYSDAGDTQCCSRIYNNPNDGSLGHENADADQFASWGVDYLKHDGCDSKPSSYTDMRDALNKTGRHIYYSIHGPKAVGSIANCWRTTGDIDNTWESMYDRAIENDQYAASASPGSFNDPDMLEVGNFFHGNGLTALGDAEGRTQFSLWALIKAPLLIGTDVTNMTKETLATLSNKEVIAVNQDTLGIQGTLMDNSTSVDVWTGKLANQSVVVALVNKDGENENTMELDVKKVYPNFNSNTHIRDLWSHTNLPNSGPFTFKIPPHDTVMLKFSQTAC